MNVSLLFVLAITVGALKTTNLQDYADSADPQKLKNVDKKGKGHEKKEQVEKAAVHGSGPGEICEVPEHFVRDVNPKSSREWTAISGPVTRKEPYLKKIFYINLDKSATRKNETIESLERNFPGVPVERWRATGKGEAAKLDYKNYAKGRVQGTGIGSIATWFSHYFLTKHISEQPDPNAVYLIVEDDLMMKKPNLQHDVMCQIKQLPADWDLFKFGYWGYRMEVAQSKVGYPTCDGEQYNEYTCRQKGFAWNYMGNQAYAMRPGGAKAIAMKLSKTAVMDVDGAMMPGGTRSSYSHPNTYVSKHTLVQHSWRHTSTRTNGGERKRALSVVADEIELTPAEEDKVDKLEKEASDLEQDTEGRETGSQQYRRLMAWKETVLDKYEL